MRKLSLILTLTSALVACAPAGRPARDQRPAAAAARLNLRGIPDQTWPESDLNTFEADLSRLEQADDGRNADVLRQRRDALDDARAKHLAIALSATRKHGEAPQTNLMIRQRDALVAEVNAGGVPDKTWSNKRLYALRDKLAHIDALGKEIQNRLGRCVVDYDEFTKRVRAAVDRVLATRTQYVQPLRQLNGSVLN